MKLLTQPCKLFISSLIPSFYPKLPMIPAYMKPALSLSAKLPSGSMIQTISKIINIIISCKMEGQMKLSGSTQLFLLKLKAFLQSIGISFSQFFANFEVINKNSISKLEFFRIVALLGIEGHGDFDPQKVFAELSFKDVTIDINRLKQLHSMVTERKRSEEKSRNDQIQKKIIRVGLYRLQQFVRKHPNPSGFFKEFDKDGNSSISKNQFSALLLGTDIKEFSAREIRRTVIEHIYRYFQPNSDITIKQLCDFFKVPIRQEPRRVQIFENKPKMDPLYIPKRVSPPKIPRPVQEIKPPQQNPFIKKHIYPPSNENSSNEKQKFQVQTEQTSEMEQRNSNCHVCYPNAMRFYRQGEPTPSEHINMQQMEELLTQNRRYLDSANPAISEGAYIPSAEIFKTDKFYMFQMANSVLVREISRIGIAREIEPKDIIQGSVGDCYFLSSIASIISIYPELIAEKFLFDKNPSGYYAIKLFIDGEWKVIKTDDRFPCKGTTPVYAKPHTQEIWVMLLEKCWAKVFGSFKAIESGSSKEGFMALTGAPSEVITQKDQQEKECVKKIEIAHGHKYVATVSGSQYLESLGKAGEEKYGIVSGHAYSLLKTINVGGVTLLKLRNPWGRTIWKGDWSFTSDKWTKQMRDKYNYNRNPEDGSFYMPWEDFKKFFGEIVVCKLSPTFLHTSSRVKTEKKKSAYLYMKVKTAGQYIFTIYQQNKRKFVNKYANYEYSPARIIILKKEGNKMRYIGAKSASTAQACSLDIEKLEEGEYFISAKVWWKFWDSHEFVVTSYGVDYTNLTPVNRAIAPQFKANLIKSYASQLAGTGKIKTYDKYGFNATCESNFNIETGIGFIRMVNNSQKSFDSVQQMQAQGLKVIKPDKLPLTFKMTPKSEKIYGFFVKSSGYEYSNSEKISYV